MGGNARNRVACDDPELRLHLLEPRQPTRDTDARIRGRRRQGTGEKRGETGRPLSSSPWTSATTSDLRFWTKPREPEGDGEPVDARGGIPPPAPCPGR